jgi:hypothetical protein
MIRMLNSQQERAWGMFIVDWPREGHDRQLCRGMCARARARVCVCACVCMCVCVHARVHA